MFFPEIWVVIPNSLLTKRTNVTSDWLISAFKGIFVDKMEFKIKVTEKFLLRDNSAIKPKSINRLAILRNFLGSFTKVVERPNTRSGLTDPDYKRKVNNVFFVRSYKSFFSFF